MKCPNCGGDHPHYKCMKPVGYRPKLEHITVATIEDGKLVRYGAKGERRSDWFYEQRREKK